MGKGFAGIGSAKDDSGGRYITPGRYVLRVQSMQFKESTKPKTEGDELFIVEFEVVESTAAEYEPGDTTSWVVNLNTNRQLALSNCRGFFRALMGDGFEISDADCNACCEPSQPCAGMAIRAEAWLKKTQDGGDFTRITWSHFE